MDAHAPARQRPEASRWTGLIRSPVSWILTLGAAFLGVYPLATHTGHIVAALPYLLLMVCPLMHLFKHGGHGHHNGKPE
jgi:hypothetical protein